MKRFFKTLCFIVLLLAIYFAAQYVLSIAFVVGYSVLVGISSVLTGAHLDTSSFADTLSAYINSNMSLIIIISAMITVPLYFLIYGKRRYEIKSFCSFKRPNFALILLIIIFGFSLNIVLDIALSLLSMIEPLNKLFENYNNLSYNLLGGNLILTLLGVGIIAPMFEEFLFRGLVLGELKKITTVRTAIILQALLFGIYHLNFIQGSYAFVIGLALGYIYYMSGSLLYPMLLHMTINSFTVIISEFVSDVFIEKWSGGIVIAGVFLFAASCFALFKNNDMMKFKAEAVSEDIDILHSDESDSHSQDDEDAE